LRAIALALQPTIDPEVPAQVSVNPQSAMTALEGVLGALLGGVSFQRMLLAPERVKPAGIGGVVGFSRDPIGEIAALEVDALAHVTVRAADTGLLETASRAVIRALAGAQRSALVPVGVQRISLVETGPPVAGPPSTVERQLSFKVRYEFTQVPTAGEGIIEQIPITLRVPDPSEDD
jgi:hypothetical protein